MEVMLLFSIDRAFLEQKSSDTHFIRDNLEKVYRLIDILDFINNTPFLSEHLALKGGTAINLAVFDMPRLSVDIDLDLCKDCSRDDMMKIRTELNSIILRYMSASGYIQNPDKNRTVHSLTSNVFYYQNAGGNRDNIKIEINYSMRCHILPICKQSKTIEAIGTKIDIKTLDPIELFGSKIKALLERTAPRDLYDINNMINAQIIHDDDIPLLRKCVLFYRTVGSTGELSEHITYDDIHCLTFNKIRQTLLPVLQKGEQIDLDEMKASVCIFLDSLLVFTSDEEQYLQEFLAGNYRPELLFDDGEVLSRIQNHPMALWKTQKN